jgi:hypothetical protein
MPWYNCHVSYFALLFPCVLHFYIFPCPDVLVSLFYLFIFMLSLYFLPRLSSYTSPFLYSYCFPRLFCPFFNVFGKICSPSLFISPLEDHAHPATRLYYSAHLTQSVLCFSASYAIKKGAWIFDTQDLGTPHGRSCLRSSGTVRNLNGYMWHGKITIIWKYYSHKTRKSH